MKLRCSVVFVNERHVLAYPLEKKEAINSVKNNPFCSDKDYIISMFLTCTI